MSFVRRDSVANPLAIGFSRELSDRHVDKIRIAQKLRAVGKSVLHALSEQMKIPGGIVRVLIEAIPFENIEHRENRHTARAGWRHGNHRATSIGAYERLAPDRFVAFEVIERHHAAGFLELRNHRLGHPTLVKNFWALLRNRFKRFG